MTNEMSERKKTHVPPFAKTCLAAICVLAAASCVERRIAIDSVPRGALVTLDHEPVGRTPVDIPFTHYGTRHLALQKAGYERQAHVVEIRPPLYERFPLDLIFEGFWPWTLHDEHRFMYELTEASPIDQGKLMRRADEFRREALRPKID